MFPRDPDLTGVCTSRFWIWVLLLIGGILLDVIITVFRLL
jgi:hypothetical protein